MKMLRLFSVIFFSLSVHSLPRSSSTHTPRMVFTDRETAVKRIFLPGHHAPIQTLLNEQTDVVTSVGQTHLYLYNFSDHEQTPVGRKVQWEKCTSKEDCSYNFTVVHQSSEKNVLFLCGTNDRDTRCCEVNLLESSPTCVTSEKVKHIGNSIESFITKEGEHSVFVESGQSADLYVTCSGKQEMAGIHKFGSKRVRPANHDKEQHYVGLVISQGRSETLQDKVYAFYKQRNKDTGMYSKMWLPFVSQVCMADVGGPKNKLQFSWTSQLNARLMCGDHDSKLYFSELVDLATVNADRWQDTKVYALFTNEWGMSAVCIYTIGDIDSIFTNSQFKEDKEMTRDRKCVSDSTKITSENLMKIEKASEMEKPVMPGSFFYLHHNYTHIKVDTSRHNGNSHHIVMFLSLDNGRIHKVVHSEMDFFIIAEYQPFNHKAHIHSIIIHPSSRMLNVNSGSEVVQIDVGNCAQYGDTCEECVLSRDPHCSWTDNTCTSKTRTNESFHKEMTAGDLDHLTGDPIIMFTRDPHQDTFNWNHTNCLRRSKLKDLKDVEVYPQVKYFLQCPVSSHHAQYTWHGPKNSTPCNSREKQCLLLIDSMAPDQAGLYKCVSEERNYRKVVAEYRLQLRSTAVGRTVSPTVWVCLIAVLMMTSSTMA